MRSFTLDYRPGLPTRGQIMTISQFWFRRKIKDGSPEYVVLRAGMEGSGPDQIAIEQWNEQAKAWDWAENDPTLEYAPCYRGGSPALWGDEQDHVQCQHTDHARARTCARTSSRPVRSRPRARSCASPGS